MTSSRIFSALQHGSGWLFCGQEKSPCRAGSSMALRKMPATVADGFFAAISNDTKYSCARPTKWRHFAMRTLFTRAAKSV
jgi:hypothetical protein